MRAPKPGATVPKPRFGNRSAIEESARSFPRVGRFAPPRGGRHPGGTGLSTAVDFIVDGTENRKAKTLVTDTDLLWKVCSEALRSHVAESTWHTSFEHMVVLRMDDTEVVLGVPSSLIRERIETRYLSLVQSVVADAIGASVPVRIMVDPAVVNDHGTPAAGD